MNYILVLVKHFMVTTMNSILPLFIFYAYFVYRISINIELSYEFLLLMIQLQTVLEKFIRLLFNRIICFSVLRLLWTCTSYNFGARFMVQILAI